MHGEFLVKSESNTFHVKLLRILFGQLLKKVGNFLIWHLVSLNQYSKTILPMAPGIFSLPVRVQELRRKYSLISYREV